MFYTRIRRNRIYILGETFNRKEKKRMIKKIAAIGLTAIAFTNILAGCATQGGGDVIVGGKLTVYNPSSDFVVTVDSENFKNSYDTVDLINRCVTNRGTPFVVTVRDSGDDFICALDEKFQYNDVVKIDAVGTQNSDTRYKLHGSDLKLEVETASSNTISMSYNKRLVDVRHVHGDFEYMFTDNSVESPYTVLISCTAYKMADVKIYHDGEFYIFSTNGDVGVLTITTKGIGEKTETTTFDSKSKHCKILINSDGTATMQ